MYSLYSNNILLGIHLIMNSTKNKKTYCLDKYTTVENLHIFLNIVKNRVFMVEVE